MYLILIVNEMNTSDLPSNNTVYFQIEKIRFCSRPPKGKLKRKGNNEGTQASSCMGLIFYTH